MNTPWTFEGLQFDILVSRRLRGAVDGRTFFELLQSKHPEFVPQKYNWCEPVSERFHSNNIEESLDIWQTGDCYLWKRRAPRAEGGVWFKNPRVHDAISFDIVFNDVTEGKCRLLFTDLIENFPPDYARMHLLSRAEYDLLLIDEQRRQMREPFRASINTHDLRMNIPDLQWANVFGPPYINLFGLDRLLSAPAAVVREISHERVYIQLTQSMTDLRDNFSHYETIKNRIKKHLNCNAFMDPTSDYSRRYNVAAFNLEAPG